MGVALHKSADNNGPGFMHTYRLINGRGSIYLDSNLHKWLWLTNEAGLHYDALIYAHIVTLINLTRDLIPDNLNDPTWL